MTGIQIHKKAFRKLILQVFLLLILPVGIFAQDELPDTPKMIRVTVDHSNNDYVVEWEASEDPTVDLYILYIKLGDAWDDIYAFGSETFSYNITNENYKRQTYIVTAMDTLDGNDDRESLLGDNGHRAMEVSLDFDPCSRSNTISWTSYVGWEGQISGYKIYGGLQGEEMLYLGLTSPNTNSFPHQNVSYDETYTYYVEAINPWATSLSPIEEIQTSFPDIPELLRIDEVSVIDDNTLEMIFTADVDGDINNFRILRRSGSGSSYQEVETIWDSQQPNMNIIDQVSTKSGNYEYMVESIYKPESCDDEISVDSSNIGTSVFLEGQIENQIASLTWTPYESYETGLSGYLVQRKSGGGEFVDVASLGAESTSWRESIDMDNSASQPGEIQYRVKALSNQVEGADPGISVSNIVSVFMETTMQVPNAFTPGRASNAIFKPIIDFAPSKYSMIVYDRGGRKLFETSDPSQGWDGTFNGGSFAMEGVYVFFIQYSDYTGLSKTISGNVTVIYPAQY